MSGGAFDYAYLSLEGLSNRIPSTCQPECSEEENYLAELIKDLSQVMYDLEYYRSGDSSFEDFKKSWDQFKKKWLKKIGGK